MSVMLKKKFGVCLVSKLRAILLMEADFNKMNKEVYGIHMLDEARKYKLILEDLARIIARQMMEALQKLSFMT